MIVDINLLPRKEPRHTFGVVLTVLVILLLLIGAAGDTG